MRNPELVKKEAVRWYVHLCSGEASQADIQALQQWRDAHADNQQAWARFEALRLSFEGMPVKVAAGTLEVASRERRRALRGAIAVLAVGATGVASYQFYVSGAMTPAIWLADYRSRVGEQRRIMLADGSLLILNTDSAVDVVFDERQRLIRLHAGEILVETSSHRGSAAGADARPLSVMTRDGQVRALGTRFTVRRFDDRSEVAVIDQAVEVTPQRSPGQRQVVTGGQRMAFNGERSFAVTSGEAQDDWTSGSLVVNDWRLGEVIAELARYRNGHMQCDPAVADIRVSGAFPVTDTDRALAVLVRSFPLRVTFLTRWWVRVGAA
ncbi:FecR domain-containing protein [Herbaspirillum sp. alder98]|uniref:FecR domain-containing protein n=1 Tax=Herbaspirillum sp. alder98 TaxID=2913096 RepID=UPI001CD8964E|nr:FecR domain-containing protein [Herbaspirillum sp. alder98]MCA1323449.1 FecR domain-containing protein [Herbaspirillum sp. alder98]